MVHLLLRPLDNNNFGVVVNAESHLTNRNIPHSECNENSQLIVNIKNKSSS